MSQWVHWCWGFGERSWCPTCIGCWKKQKCFKRYEKKVDEKKSMVWWIFGHGSCLEPWEAERTTLEGSIPPSSQTHTCFFGWGQRAFASNIRALQAKPGTFGAHAKELQSFCSSCNGFVDWWDPLQFRQAPNFGMHLPQLPRAWWCQCFLASAIVCNPKALVHQRQNFVKDAGNHCLVFHFLSKCCVAKQEAWWHSLVSSRFEKETEIFVCYGFSSLFGRSEGRLGNAKGSVQLPRMARQERMLSLVQMQAWRNERFWKSQSSWKTSPLYFDGLDLGNRGKH